MRNPGSTRLNLAERAVLGSVPKSSRGACMNESFAQRAPHLRDFFLARSIGMRSGRANLRIGMREP